MSIFKKSILIKLWLAMVTLVLAVIWVSSLAQSNMTKKIYYDQQEKQLTELVKDIASLAGTGKDASEQIKLISAMTHTNIMIVDTEGNILQCQGLGMDMNFLNNPKDRVNAVGHHGNLITKDDLNRVLSGLTTAYRGPSQIVNTDVLSVATPVSTGGVVTGAVVLSAALTTYEEKLAEYQRIILNVGMGGIIMATVLSLLLSRSLSRPLIQMNQAARGLAAGDFSCRVEVNSEDEVGVLARSLNTLSLQLQEKIKALELLDNTRKDFVAGVSHELRTPLTIMLGYAEALQDNLAGTEEERQEYIAFIIDEIHRLKRLVADLLDMRRIETGQEKIELQQLNPLPVLIKSIDKMNAVAAVKEIRLTRRLPVDLPLVISNQDRLEQVMTNLLDNAIRHSRQGGVVVVTASADDNFLSVSVTDSGMGIPEEEQDLIWEKFYKIDKSRTRSGGGTGLGLAIVKRIVENMGGTVSVASVQNTGATFSFTMPRA
ncbi:MAG: ATP-binding protein [Bacillota bacterium]